MDSITELGILGSILFATLFWLVKHYLPSKDLQHSDEINQVLKSHQITSNRLANSIDRNSRVILYNSQALLVQGLIHGGLSRDEAEQIAKSISASLSEKIPS